MKDGEKKKQAKKSAEDVAESAKSSTTSRVSGVKDRALGKWSELEEAFDKRLNSAICAWVYRAATKSRPCTNR